MIDVADVMHGYDVAGVNVTEGRYLVLRGLQQHLRRAAHDEIRR